MKDLITTVNESGSQIQKENLKLKKRNKLYLICLILLLWFGFILIFINLKAREKDNYGYFIINDGIKTSEFCLTKNNELMYSNFQKALIKNPAKVKPFFDKAQLAKKYSQELEKYITELRTKIIVYTEFGIKEKSENPEKWDLANTMFLSDLNNGNNYKRPMEILFGQSKDETTGQAIILKNKLEKFCL